MGCSSSRDVRGGAAKPPAESRRHSLRPSRSVSRTASVLTSLAFCRGRHDDAVHAYSSLPLEEPPAKGAHVSVDFDVGMLPGEEAAKTAVAKVEATFAPTKASTGGQRGLKAALEDATPPRRCESFNASSPAAAKEAEVQALPGFDQGIMSGLRDLVVEPSPSHPALLFPERENPTTPKASEEAAAATAFDDMGTPAARDIPEVTGFVHARVDEFHEKIEKKKAAKAADEEALAVALDDDDDHDVVPPPPLRPARVTKAAVVVYFTSLRGVRRTFEDGRAVRAILRCHRVRVDERDVSIHAAFRSELRDLLGDAFTGSPLPSVFVDGRHDLGGADDVRALHEAGELARALAGCEQVRHAAACAACGEMRFLPCETCYGSCKVFAGEEGSLAVTDMFRRCPHCNENGLIRCPVCCY
uniref:Glutaredoxin domain-containing protein n=1 Tax=Oryza punctata TaxID=4537 RepID=A0A0E0LRS0_ORYPU